MGGIALLTWSIWLRLLGPEIAINSVIDHWSVSLTMMFGSLIAGGTSMGGGAVAFPVFTKLLHIPPQEAKVFSLAIQSIGMGAATLTIILTRINVEWRVIRWMSLGGFLGICVGDFFVFPLLSPDAIKFCMTMALTSFAIVLVFVNRSFHHPSLALTIYTVREKLILFQAGVLGGLFTSLGGNGIDIVAFAVMVILFRINEKISTATSVILMAINALVGFALHAWIIQDFSKSVQEYWIAAIPVVVIGAPLGAILCSTLERKRIVHILLGLIFVELISSLLLIPLRINTITSGFMVLVSCLYLTYRMSQNHRYVSSSKVVDRNRVA